MNRSTLWVWQPVQLTTTEDLAGLLENETTKTDEPQREPVNVNTTCGITEQLSSHTYPDPLYPPLSHIHPDPHSHTKRNRFWVKKKTTFPLFKKKGGGGGCLNT